MNTPSVEPAAGFSIAKSPVLDNRTSAKHLEEGGAIRAGETPVIWSRKSIGLVVQYAGLGVFNHTLSNSVYPLLYNYFRMSGVEISSARALLNLIWTLKFVAGIISDCFPIAGFRRRPYMVIGWGISFVAFLLMAVLPMPSPYYPDADWARLKQLTKIQKEQLNTHSPHEGVRYLVLMVVVKFGMLIAMSAAEGVLVDVAQREPIHARGTTVAVTSGAKFCAAIFAAFLTGFGLNGPDYGGSFSTSFGFQAVCGICAGFAVVVIAFSWFCIEEERVTQVEKTVKDNLLNLYELLQLRVVYQLVAFQFFRNFFSLFNTTAASPVESLWARVQPVSDTCGTALTYVVATLLMVVIRKYGLGWNWRTIIVVMQIVVVLLAGIPTMLTIWDVVRNQWFWLGTPLHDELPQYMGTTVTSFAIVEIIDLGNEATVFGLVSTVANLASPFATVIYKVIDSHYHVNAAHVTTDTHTVRSHVTITYIIAYACNLFSLVFVFLLPRQKAEMQALKRHGGRSKAVGTLTVAFLVFTFIWSFMTNWMTFWSKTACLRIAGGTGCKKK